MPSLKKWLVADPDRRDGDRVTASGFVSPRARCPSGLLVAATGAAALALPAPQYASAGFGFGVGVGTGLSPPTSVHSPSTSDKGGELLRELTSRHGPRDGLTGGEASWHGPGRR